jgi:hypothetical protein
MAAPATLYAPMHQAAVKLQEEMILQLAEL